VKMPRMSSGGIQSRLSGWSFFITLPMLSQLEVLVNEYKEGSGPRHCLRAFSRRA
jgi:hypothetical protein